MKKLVSWESLTGTRPTIESDRTIAVVSFPLKSAIQRKAEDDEGRSEGRSEGRNEGRNITTRQKEILDLIKSNPKITMIEMSSLLKVSISTIEREIPKMSSLIRHKGPTKGGYWEIIED